MRPFFNIAALLLLLNETPALAQLGDAVPDFVALADAEGDGKVSEDEFTAYYALLWAILAGGKSEVELDHTNPVVRAMIQGVLPDASGKISRDRLLDAVPTRYRDADKDKNGVVSMTEMRSWSAIAMSPARS